MIGRSTDFVERPFYCNEGRTRVVSYPILNFEFLLTHKNKNVLPLLHIGRDRPAASAPEP